MRLVIDADKQYKRLFTEVAKVTGAKMRVDERYITQEEQDETEFLLRSPNNEERLITAIKNVEQGKIVQVDIDAYMSKLGEHPR